MLEKKEFAKHRKETFKEVGRQIFELRRHHKMNVMKLSNIAGISPVLVERWELSKGYLDLYMLQRIAAVFDKRLGIYFEDIEKPQKP